MTAAQGFIDVQAVGVPMAIRAVAHDRHGYVWVATDRGACRFDGSNLVCPVDKAANALAIEDDSTIWAGLRDGVLTQVLSDPFSTREVGKVPGVISEIAVDHAFLWVATSVGLFRIAKIGGGVTHVASGRYSHVVRRADGDVLAVTDRRIVHCVADAEPAVVFESAEEVTALEFLQSSRRVVIGTAAGKIYQLGNDLRVARPLYSYSDQKAIIRSLVEDRSERIWVGTDNLFFTLQHGDIANMENLASHLPDVRVNALDVDESGTVWIGTSNGLARLKMAYPLRSFDRGDGLPSPVSFAVTVGQGEKIWAITAAGLAGWDGAWSVNNSANRGRGAYDARTVAADHEGRVWVGGASTGLHELQEGAMVQRWPNPKSENQGVRALALRTAGGLWVGLSDGGLGTFDAARFHLEFAPSEAGRDRVFDIIEDRVSGVWLALSGDGLGLWNGGKLRRYGPADGLPSAEILCLLRGTAADLWVGTNGAGLVHLNEGHFKTITTNQGLPSNQVYGLVDDGAGRIWMTSPSGISGIDRRRLYDVASERVEKLEAITFDSHDGVPGEPVRAFPPSATRGHDGTLWFPTLKGIVNVDPRAVDVAAGPRGIVIDDVQVNGKHLSKRGSSSPAATRSDVRFRFSVPSFRGDRAVRLRYQLQGLEGISDPWHDASHTREAAYQSLAPGDYRFVVQALPVGRALVTVESARFDFHLPRPWHETLIFRLSVIAVALALIAWVHQQRVQRVQRGHALVLAERSRIARDIHDTLAQDLCGLRFQIDAAAVALQTDAATAHQYLERASELITDGVVDLRNSIWGLRSASVNTHEVVSALRTKLERVTSGTKVNIAISVRGDARILPAAVAIAVVHIAREAVTNALKHAEASLIGVTLDTSTPEICLKITDNGQGLTAPSTSLSLSLGSTGEGIKSMRTRAAQIGARLEVTSSEDPGTCVTLIIPRNEG